VTIIYIPINEGSYLADEKCLFLLTRKIKKEDNGIELIREIVRNWEEILGNNISEIL
jgi:hypothetical protein